MRSPGYRPAGLPAHGTQRGGRYQTPSAQRRFCRGALARLAVAEVSGPGGPGRNGGPGRDGGPGPGQGRAGGRGTCVFLHKTLHRNRLECRFGTVFRGKKLVFFIGFFPGSSRKVQDFPLDIPNFSRRKIRQNREEIRYYHSRSGCLSLR